MKSSPSAASHPVLRINADAATPKYRQIIDNVCDAVKNGALKKGDQLPSINELCEGSNLGRETVVKAYNRLKEMGVLASAHGKGFHIATDHFSGKLRVFVLFDAFTPYKEILYGSLRTALADRAQIDIFFHHFNPELFAKILRDAAGKYAFYVVMPFPDPAVKRILAELDQEKLLLLDIDLDYPGKCCAVVRQSHDEQLCQALEKAAPRLKPYRSLTLVFPEDRNHPEVIRQAFRRFCRHQGIEHAILPELKEKDIREGQAYFLIEDLDLVNLIKVVRGKRLKLGRQIGLLSYNDTPMKEVIQDGVSVVTVDFDSMGRQAAGQILQPTAAFQWQEPTRFIDRGSL